MADLSSPADAQRIQQWLDEHRITEVECLIPDMAGQARGKIVPRHKYDPAAGLRLPEAVHMMSVTGDYPEEDFTSVADGDMLLVPDANSLRPVPWAKEPTAQIIHDCHHFDGRPVDLATRNVLRRVLGMYREVYQLCRQTGLDYCMAAMDNLFSRLLTRLGFPFVAVGPMNPNVLPARRVYIISATEIERMLGAREPAILQFMQTQLSTSEEPASQA